MAKVQIKKGKALNQTSTSKKVVKTVKKPLKMASSKVLKKNVETAPKKGPLVVNEAFNHSLLIKTLIERTNLDKEAVTRVLESLKDIMVAHLVKKGPQEFKWKGVFVAKIKEKAATKARQGVNPFNGEPMTFAAKPARRSVKITALKPLKDAL